ncbi:MAG: hypothetical protein CVV53_05620 [Spirochaetae bacterium HGW-Spirochaetae-9]|nr:MAG: hypothetical protein CVV53_05620 [Spirochaetae bacterium HGW-Spirochaetae-9]
MAGDMELNPLPMEWGKQNLSAFMEELNAAESLVMIAIVWKVFSRPRRFGFESGDEAAEAFLHYSNRLKTIIQRSEEITGCKDAYLDTCLRFLAKSVQRSRRKKELKDTILEIADETGEPHVSEAETCRYPFDETEENRQFIGNIAPGFFLERMAAKEKRLLYLVLKCAWEVDDVMALKVARRIGVPLLWLGALLHRATSTLEASRLYLNRLNENINTQWLRLRVLEAELRGEPVYGERSKMLLQKVQRCRSRYETLMSRRSKFRLLVSNRAIAELLHIPKGSVDSGIFYLKNSFEDGGFPEKVA